jgi:hypothetical protein
MKNKILVYSISAILPAMIVALSLTACTKKAEKAEVADAVSKVTCAIGTVTLAHADGTSAPAIPGDQVKKDDTLTTGTASFATIQIGDRGIVRVEANSSLQIQKAVSQAVTELYVKEGTVISKVSRLSKDEKYTVRTSTAVAAVRGTEFSISTSGSAGATISVKDGKVAVGTAVSASSGSAVQADPAAETIVESGKSAVVPVEPEKKVEVREIKTEELAAITKVSTVEFIADLPSVKTEEIEKVSKKIQESEPPAAPQTPAAKEAVKAAEKQAKIQQLIKETPKTVEEIKQVFDRIDNIMLYSGKTIQGAILSRGDVYSVLTTGGVISVPANTIRQTSVLK